MQNLFGTDGIRGTVGAVPFTQDTLAKLGLAIGVWACKKYGNKPKILLAHDTRASCAFVKSTLKSGMLCHSITLHDAYVLPTPTVCYLTQHSQYFDCGIIISASHNPYQDNGIKIIDAQHGKLKKEDELSISELFYNQNNITHNYTNLGIDLPVHNIQEQYIRKIQQLFPQSLAGLTIVLDCAHGATYQIAPDIFKRCGAQVIVIKNKPNGININKNCGALFPKSLQKAIIKHSANIGFAFDGDGDRVTVVNKYGEVKDGDDILALLLDHPNYKNEYGIVGTIMSNQGLATFVQQKNKQFFRSAVGDKHVAEQLNMHSLLLGGETSGHIIMYDYLGMGDGIATALRVIEAIQHTNNWKLKTFTKYPQILINVPITTKKDLTSPSLNTIITNYQEKLQNGRLLVRYSGTEDLLRVMVEDKNNEYAQHICNQLSQTLAKELNKI